MLVIEFHIWVNGTNLQYVIRLESMRERQIINSINKINTSVPDCSQTGAYAALREVMLRLRMVLGLKHYTETQICLLRLQCGSSLVDLQPVIHLVF